ncbi:hypothetical protein EG328_005379 [Venturia inaequalis]|uniref:Uncharacterized protein n=1 Tax=Venturia inaequalis TaxID=5025 RepID=A0A8H3UJC8_VENIN|nr:hypothetical protein EG328_005379 [Venturia inaequalis]RDI87574.1 hypothetical protein Vi05172_g2420 [Venturia inaequalis]
MSNGPKRPHAADFFGIESKRIKSDEPASGDAKSPQSPPARGNIYPTSSVYDRREYPQNHRNSEDLSNRLIRPSVQSPRVTNGQTIPTGPKAKVPSSPLNSRPPSRDDFTAPSAASNRVPSRDNTPASYFPTHSIRPPPPPPPPIQTHFSDNDSVRSASVDTASSHVAPVASMMDRSASNSPRSGNATLDIRRRHPVGPSNLQTLRENSAAADRTPVMSSSPTPEDLMKAAISKRDKAKEEMDKATKYLVRLKGSTVQSASKASHERKFSQASIAFQKAEEEIRKLEMATRAQESRKAVEQLNHEPESALGIDGLATADLAPSTSAQTQSVLTFDTGPGTIAELQQELATVRNDLNREKADRERENKERDRRLTAVQETFTKLLTTVESEKKERENRYEQDLAGYKQTLRDDYKEAVKEIQTQAREDIQVIQMQARENREEDMSTHTTLLGQIKTFQSDIAIFKKTIASIQSDNDKHWENISSLESRCRDNRADYRRLDVDLMDKLREYNGKMNDFKDEVRDADEKHHTRVKDATEDVLNLKIKVDLDKKAIDQELASIKKSISTLEEQNKQSRNGINATHPQPGADSLSRLASLEAFENSATEILNGMSIDLTKAKNDLDVMQDACSSVAYDAAKEEAEAMSSRLTSQIKAIETRVVPDEDVKAVSLRLTSRMDAIEKKIVAADNVKAVSAGLTSRIDALENKVVPDEDVKARLSTCESELTKVVRWVGQRPEDDPDDKTLTDMISTLELDLVGAPDREGILTILERCEEAVRQCEDTVEATVTDLNTKIDDAVAQLRKPRPEGEAFQDDHGVQATIDDKISSLESKIESQTSVFEGQAKMRFRSLEFRVDGLEQKLNDTISGLQFEKRGLDSQLPPLQNEIRQERTARKELEERVKALGASSFALNNINLRAEIDAVKSILFSTADKTNQLLMRVQHLTPEGIKSEFKAISDRSYVLEGAVRNLETRYNAITTTSMVQAMLDQIHKLLPPEKDLVTVIRDVGQHSEQIRGLGQELNNLSNKLSLNNNADIHDATSLIQTVEKFRQTTDEYEQKVKGMESSQQTMLEKLGALQFQLGLDGDKLYSNDVLRESMENSMKELHMGFEQIQLAVSSETQSRVNENNAEGLQERVEGIDAGLALVKREQGKLDARLKVQEEEAAKAATVSLSDPTRIVKKQHLDELKHIVQQHGLRIDELESSTKNTTAGAHDSNMDTDFVSDDTPPSVPRRKSTAQSHPTEKLRQQQAVENRESEVFIDVDSAGFGGGEMRSRQQSPAAESLVVAARFALGNGAEKIVPPPLYNVEAAEAALARLADFRELMGNADEILTSEQIRKFKAERGFQDRRDSSAFDSVTSGHTGWGSGVVDNGDSGKSKGIKLVRKDGRPF